MKSNGIECLAKSDVNVFKLILLRQHESQLAFIFPTLTSECGPFWKSARKYFLSRVGQAQETSTL